MLVVIVVLECGVWGAVCFLLEAEVLCLAPEWRLTGEGEKQSGEITYGVDDLVEV
jgi:hypothetical protein